jgi:Glycerophosphoryl diester phosphodiesterase family
VGGAGDDHDRPVAELKRLRPQLVVGFIVPVNFGGVPEVNADFIVIEQQSYSSRFVRQAWGDGYNVIVWTVDDEQHMRDYMNAAVDGIITDRPDLGIAARTDIAEDRACPAGFRTRSLGRPPSEEPRCSGLRLHQREQDRVTDSETG